MRQPDMSSASSTARRMESVVDSMFTTMPFFMPREGALPRPMISSSPSVPGSATMQATLEVPISNATMRLFSGLLLIHSLQSGGGAHAAHRETIAVTQIHITGLCQGARHLCQGIIDKPLQSRRQVLAPQAQLQAIGQGRLPRAARIQRQLGNMPIAGRRQLRVHLLKTGIDTLAGAFRP